MSFGARPISTRPRIALKVIVLNEGRVLFQGEPRAMTAQMAGRVFGLRWHRATAAKSARPGIDAAGHCRRRHAGRGHPAGDKEGRAPPEVADFAEASGATLASVAPRFEDAFVDTLGGHPKRTLAAATRQQLERRGTSPVEARGLTRRFGNFTAADHISFQIGHGEIFGLLGPNGAGKSTTFKMMCGLLRPSEGAALVDGLDLYQAPSAARARLGYMAQEILALRRPHCRQNLNLRRCLWLLGRAPARGDRTRGGGFRPCHT